jgi:hypothetical protein
MEINVHVIFAETRLHVFKVVGKPLVSIISRSLQLYKVGGLFIGSSLGPHPVMVILPEAAALESEVKKATRMRSTLDQSPVVIWNGPRAFNVSLQNLPGRFENAQVFVDRSQSVRSSGPMTVLVDVRFKIAPVGHHHDTTGLFESARTIPLVTVKPTYPLEENVDWTQVGNHQIGVDVQGLLNGLGRNGYHAVGVRPIRIILSKYLLNVIIEPLPIFRCEAGVMRNRMALNGE